MLRFFLELSVDSFHEPPNVFINTKRLLCVNSYEIMRLMMLAISMKIAKAMLIKTIMCQVHSGSWAWRRHREDGGQD